MSGNAPPWAMRLVAVYVVFLILATSVMTCLLQIPSALVLLPACACESGRKWFLRFQTYLHGRIASFVVLASPFWRIVVCRPGDKPPALPRGEMGSVFFAHHRSSLDAWLYETLLLKHDILANFVYRKNLLKYPFVGTPTLMISGHLGVQSGDRASVEALMETSKRRLRAGFNIVVFPEGTRSPSGILMDFKLSFFRVCAEIGAPAIPIICFGQERAWPLGGMGMSPATIFAAIGDPLYAHKGGGAEQLAQALREKMQWMAEAMVHAVPRGVAVSPETLRDPLITGRPFPGWQRPKGSEGLSETELLPLLRAGRFHEKGKKLV